MEHQATLNINMDTIQLIIDALLNLQQCGGVVNDDNLWTFGTTNSSCVSDPNAKLLQSFEQSHVGSQNNAITNLKAVKDPLYTLARSCERKVEVLKTESSLKYGIRTLPDEILADIFQSAVHEHDGTDTIPPALTLSQVCSRFRTIALNTPSLWAQISSRMNVSILSLLLDRSKSAPITVSISENEWSERLHQFVQFATPLALRWNAFYFEALAGFDARRKYHQCLNKFFEGLQLPNLMIFSLRASVTRLPGPGPEMFDFYRTWSMPNVYHIVTSQFPSSSPRCLFSSQTIRSFDFSLNTIENDPHDLVDLIVSILNLRVLRLALTDIYLSDDEERALERLSLDVPGYERHFNLYHQQKMPPLRSFSLRLVSELFPLDKFIRRMKSHGIWEDFEFFQIRNYTNLTKAKAEVITEGNLLWLEK